MYIQAFDVQVKNKAIFHPIHPKTKTTYRIDFKNLKTPIQKCKKSSIFEKNVNTLS